MDDKQIELAYHCAKDRVDYLQRQLMLAEKALQGIVEQMGGEDDALRYMAKAARAAASEASVSAKEEGFQEFWMSYPKKVGKPAAMSSWRGMSKPEKVAATRNVKAREWPENRQYIPNPATFLNQRRWEDEPEGDARDQQEFIL